MATIVTAQPILIAAPSQLMIQMKKAIINCVSQLTAAVVIIIGGGVSLNLNAAKYMYNVAVYGSCFWIGAMVSCIKYY